MLREKINELKEKINKNEKKESLMLDSFIKIFNIDGMIGDKLDIDDFSIICKRIQNYYLHVLLKNDNSIISIYYGNIENDRPNVIDKAIRIPIELKLNPKNTNEKMYTYFKELQNSDLYENDPYEYIDYLNVIISILISYSESLKSTDYNVEDAFVFKNLSHDIDLKEDKQYLEKIIESII